MDDLKLFGRNQRHWNSGQDGINGRYGDDFWIDKCADINIRRGKIPNSEGIQLPDESTIKHLEERVYKYLVGHNLSTIRWRTRSEKSIFQEKPVPKSKLNGGKIISSVNTWAVPLVRYSAGSVDWNKNERQQMDVKIRKLFNKLRSVLKIERHYDVYLPRNEGGRGLSSVDDCIDTECRALGKYFKNNNDGWLREEWKKKGDQDWRRSRNVQKATTHWTTQRVEREDFSRFTCRRSSNG